MKKTTLASAIVLMLSSASVLADGKQVYQSVCIGCHATGAANSPKIGDKDAWAPRIAKGLDALLQSAINGIPGTAMLPKGSCNSCTEDQLMAAVEYMVSQSQ